MVIADFSENYSFVVQDEVQSFHWNNLQATVHTFLCYFKDGDGKIDSICFTVISENNQHLFQRKLISFLTDHFGKKPKRIIYMSDGCAQWFKTIGDQDIFKLLYKNITKLFVYLFKRRWC